MLRTFFPWSSATVNYNVATKRHWDYDDVGMCGVIPFDGGSEGTRFEGGDLVLSEISMVVEVPAGEGILFESSKIEHCNFPYKGFRGSVALSIHKSLEGWELRVPPCVMG